ncbi:MAG: S53 family peptidase [Actinomycetota bacterium]|nr:S53 family peptidase [Actinomycetota bacterium]
MAVSVLLLGSLVVAPYARANDTSARVVNVRVDQGLVGVNHPLELHEVVDTLTGQPLVGTGPSGYSPTTIRSYLGVTGTGAGQTIAIVSAFDHPNIASDLATFDAQFGLPAPPTFKKVNQSGGTAYPSVDAGWAMETALDVEWAHAIAPSAGILLVEATSNAWSNLTAALSYASKQSGVTVISNSWGVGEFKGETTNDTYCKLSNALCVFATGDAGNPGTYPAYSPFVLSVGGTTLNLSTDAVTGAVTVTSETTWIDSGGGVSLYETKPSYQTKVNASTKRGIPDVSYDADPNTGFAIYDSITFQGVTGWMQVGGTSAGAPQWAGIIALADQARKAAGKGLLVGYTSSTYKANSTIYGLTSGLADITTGTNGSCGSVCSAKAGYDFVTGVGSPRSGIISALTAAP